MAVFARAAPTFLGKSGAKNFPHWGMRLGWAQTEKYRGEFFGVCNAGGEGYFSYVAPCVEIFRRRAPFRSAAQDDTEAGGVLAEGDRSKGYGREAEFLVQCLRRRRGGMVCMKVSASRSFDFATLRSR